MGDVPSLAVGFELDGLVLAGLAIAAVRVRVDLAGACVALGDQDATGADLIGGLVFVQGGPGDADDPGDHVCGPLAVVEHWLCLVPSATPGGLACLQKAYCTDCGATYLGPF
jgi:hypothetical protein